MDRFQGVRSRRCALTRLGYMTPVVARRILLKSLTRRIIELNETKSRISTPRLSLWSVNFAPQLIATSCVGIKLTGGRLSQKGGAEKLNQYRWCDRSRIEPDDQVQCSHEILCHEYPVPRDAWFVRRAASVGPISGVADEPRTSTIATLSVVVLNTNKS